MALTNSLRSLAKRSLRSLAKRVMPRVSDRDVKLCTKAFDKSFYRRVNPDVVLFADAPIHHYLSVGWREGRDPSPAFSTRRYLARHDDVRRSGINPFVHYLRWGYKEGRVAERSDQADRKHGSSRGYAPTRATGSAVQKLRSIRGPAELRRLPSESRAQQRQVLIEDGYFNESYYRHIYSDVANSNLDPFEHYLHSGAREGRNPSPVFDTNYYRAMNPDLGPKENPLIHYAANGGVLSGRYCHPYLVDGYPLRQGPRSEERRFYVRTDADGGSETIPDLRVAVHIHCYYFDQFAELVDRLDRIPAPFELFVSVVDSTTELRCHQLLKELGRSASISVVPNRGRDLGPLFVEFRKPLDAFDLVLHVHTKKSKERAGDFGARWKEDLLDKLLFNRSYVARILQAFAQDERLGVLAPSPFGRIRSSMVWGLNQALAKELVETVVGDASLIGPVCPPFPAGGMFWFRPSALKPLFDLDLAYSDFPQEPIGDDGTIAHAIERCLFVVPEHGKWRTGYVEPLPHPKRWPQAVPPTVSVIVPVYNAGSWLVPAIQSVMAQDSPGCKVELIVVDNGSDDGSLEDIKTLEILDRPGIRAMSASRRGAGAARNVGLEAAKGHFVMFLDADDLLTTNAVALLHAAMLRSEADVVASSLVMFDEESFSLPMPFSPSSSLTVLEPTDFGSTLDQWRRVFADFGPCAKLYRRSFLEANKIRFPEGRNFEDNLFIANVYMKLRKMAVLHDTTYLYRRYRKNKGSTQSTDLRLESLADQIWVAKEIIREHELDSKSRFKRLYLGALARKLGDEVERFPREAGAADLLLREGDLLSVLKSNEVYSELRLNERQDSA